jgi:hypothetical protein
MRGRRPCRRPEEFQAKGLGLELFVASPYFMPLYDGKKSSRPGTISRGVFRG